MTSGPDPTAEFERILQELRPSPDKIKLLAAFDAMNIIRLPEAIDLLANGQGMEGERERLMRTINARLFYNEEKYFWDRNYEWSPRFDSHVYHTPGDPIPFSISCSDKTGRHSSVLRAAGYYQGLAFNVADISLRYNRTLDAVTFCFLLRLMLRIEVKELRRGGEDFTEKTINSAFLPLSPLKHDIFFTTILLKIPVPLSLLRTLARRRFSDRSRGVSIKKEDDSSIWYDVRNPRYREISDQYARADPNIFTFKCPRPLIEWILKNGLWIFAILRDGGCRMDNNVIVAVKRTMNVDILGLPSIRRPPKQRTEEKSADLIDEAMKIKEDDRRRLKEIRLVKTTHSYSQWAERLWFKSKGAVGAFFKRMQDRRLLKITKADSEKNEGATIVELTQKAKDLLRAWDEHLASKP